MTTPWLRSQRGSGSTWPIFVSGMAVHKFEQPIKRHIFHQERAVFFVFCF